MEDDRYVLCHHLLGQRIGGAPGQIDVQDGQVDSARCRECDGFGTVTYVCNPDEEIGSPFSGPVIRELAPAHDVALVLEGARANGDIVSSRKGITDFTITIEGRAARNWPAASGMRCR